MLSFRTVFVLDVRYYYYNDITYWPARLAWYSMEYSISTVWQLETWLNTFNMLVNIRIEFYVVQVHSKFKYLLFSKYQKVITDYGYCHEYSYCVPVSHYLKYSQSTTLYLKSSSLIN